MIYRSCELLYFKILYNVDFHLIKVPSDELVILKERQWKIAVIWRDVT